MYSKIYDFCKVKNLGSARFNSSEPSPRAQFIIELIKSLGITYTVDSFKDEEIHLHNIVMPGTCDKMIIAHHDIINPNIDNANDNSCSVINAIAVKLKRPDVHVVLTDGEELGGLGAKRLSQQILDGEHGNIAWVLNLELSGRGGNKFFIGNYPGKLSDLIVEKFNCPIVTTPFNDSSVLSWNGIDSVVINPLPSLPPGQESKVKFGEKYLDFSMLFNCHSTRDSLDTIDPSDMQEFVEEVLLEILK